MEIPDYVTETCFLAFLAAAAIADVRKRSLNIIFLSIGFTVGFVLQTVSGRLSLWEMLLGAALGGAAAIISALSRQAIGYGDSFMIAACGVWLGFSECVPVILCALLLAAVCGAVMMIFKKAKARDSLPFVPFLLAGYLIVLAW